MSSALTFAQTQRTNSSNAICCSRLVVSSWRRSQPDTVTDDLLTGERLPRPPQSLRAGTRRITPATGDGSQLSADLSALPIAGRADEAPNPCSYSVPARYSDGPKNAVRTSAGPPSSCRMSVNCPSRAADPRHQMIVALADRGARGDAAGLLCVIAEVTHWRRETPSNLCHVGTSKGSRPRPPAGSDQRGGQRHQLSRA